MELHHVTGKADWLKTPASKYNLWQKWAAWTNGIVTPGNVLTVAGLIIVLVGLIDLLRHDYWQGFWALIIGRLCDIADGYAADKTGTKGPVGELLDATVDKIGTFLTLIAMGAAHVTSWWVLAALALPQIINMTLTAISLRWEKHLQTSKIGKQAMALAWIGLVTLVLSSATRVSGYSLLNVFAYVVVSFSVAMGLYASVGYWRERPAKRA